MAVETLPRLSGLRAISREVESRLHAQGFAIPRRLVLERVRHFGRYMRSMNLIPDLATRTLMHEMQMFKPPLLPSLGTILEK